MRRSAYLRTSASSADSFLRCRRGVQGSDQRNHRPGEDFRQKHIAIVAPSREFVGGQERGIDFSPDGALGSRQSREELFERDVSRDDEKIDVTAGVSLTARDGAVDESEVDFARQRCECFAQRLSDAARFGDDRAELLEYRTVLVCAVMPLVSDRRHKYEAAADEPFQFALHRSAAYSCAAENLRREERLVRMTVQQA